MFVNLNGKMVSKSEAKVSIFDHGFLYGDSIYETVRTYGGKTFLLDLHLARLQESAQGIYLELPISPEQFKLELNRTLEAAQYLESYIRIIVTRGEGDIGYNPNLCGSPTVKWLGGQRKFTFSPGSLRGRRSFSHGHLAGDHSSGPM